jgi:hypothetical protein
MRSSLTGGLKACAVGTDVVVLANSLERVQVIPINSGDTEEVVNSLSCCADTGKIAVCTGSRIRLMEPLLGDGRAGAAKVVPNSINIREEPPNAHMCVSN